MRRFFAVVVVAVLAALAQPVAQQPPTLHVVSASPTGELAELADAGEIRITFSEPMVPVGTEVTGAPKWLSFTPAIKASYYWSGTRTLIITPLASPALPYATRYTIAVGTTARSVAGNTLATPFTTMFTTPTPRLLNADWYRKDGTVHSPIVVALQFNQPMRAIDVAAHLSGVPEAHQWRAPAMSSQSRAWLKQHDPAGLRKFDEKVAAVARITSGLGPRASFVPAATWDTKRYPKRSGLVVLESRSAPLPDMALSLSLDGQLTGIEGRVPAEPHGRSIRLEETFFASNGFCGGACESMAWYSSLGGHSLTRPVNSKTLFAALELTEINELGQQRHLAPVRAPATRYAETSLLRLSDGGYALPRPNTTLVFQLPADLQSNDGQRLGYPWVDVIHVQHHPAVANVEGSVWERSSPTLPVTVRNATLVDQWAMAVAPETLPSFLSARDERPPINDSTPFAQRLLSLPDRTQAFGADLTRWLSPRGGGLVWYALRLRQASAGARVAPPEVSDRIVQVTNIGVTVKTGPGSSLVWVTRLDTGQPVAGALVSARNVDGERWRGATDAHGVATLPAFRLEDAQGPEKAPNRHLIVIAQKDDDVAFEEILPYRIDGRYSSGGGTATHLTGDVFSDRGVYRPGDEVHAKAVMRLNGPEAVTFLTNRTPVDIVIRGDAGTEMYRATLLTNERSAVDFAWQIPADAGVGSYQIQATPKTATGPTQYAPSVDGRFLVAEFRRPDFRVTVKTPERPYVAGDIVPVTATAEYLFGAPLQARPSAWSVYRQATTEWPSAVIAQFPRERFAIGSDERDSSRWSTPNVTRPLDRTGRFTLPVKTGAATTAAFRYVAEADVTSSTGQHIEGSTAFIAYPSSHLVAVRRPVGFVDSSRGFDTSVTITSLDGKPVVGQVDVRLYRVEWKQDASSGRGWQRTEQQVGAWTVRTKADSQSLHVPIASGGSYVLRAKTVDLRGRQARTDLSFYATGPGRTAWPVEADAVTLVPERTSVSPGSSVRIMVQSPWERATGLLTVEREGVRRYQQFDVTSMQHTVDVPIVEADAPNVYIAVTLVKGRTPSGVDPDPDDLGRPMYRTGSTSLDVDNVSRRLTVGVISDRDDYGPRGQLKVDVDVKTNGGLPASAEVTLWAVDYSLLSLTEYHTPDLLGAIYQHKSLAVWTTDTRQRLIRRRAIDALKPGASVEALRSDVAWNLEGGGFTESISTRAMSFGQGGAFAVAVPSPPPPPPPPPGQSAISADVRTDFRPLVFWLGSAVADADGRVTTTVTLPDSLTTYRIMAVATDEARAGWGEHEITVAKPVTVSTSFPRFLAAGDRAEMEASITNRKAADTVAIVSIESLDPGVLSFDLSQQRASLERGSTKSIRFAATARSSGTARIRTTLTVGAERDATETIVPVEVRTQTQTFASYGEASAAVATERIALPITALPGTRALAVDVASTALVGLSESARYLEEYPHACAEQKASRALSLLMTARAGSAFTGAPRDAAALREATAKALDELDDYNCYDGYSLWPGQCESTSAYLTAYVLHVLGVGREMGFTSHPETQKAALDFLERDVKQPAPMGSARPVWAASVAFSLKVLTEFGRKPTAEISRVYDLRDELPIFALSYLADAIATTSGRDDRYLDLTRRINNAARVEADRAHVEERDEAVLGWVWSSTARATAAVLDGLTRRGTDEPLAAPMARWLLSARDNARWRTTYENASALEALVNYYRVFEQSGATAASRASVRLGASTVGTVSLSTAQPSARVSVDPEQLRAGGQAGASTDLIVDTEGSGRAFYSARLQYRTPVPAASASRGIEVQRRYERYVPGTKATTGRIGGPGATTLSADDLVRVTVVINVPRETRFVALTDALPAGFEIVDENLSITSSTLRNVATTQSSSSGWGWWRSGGFDHVEKRDNRVQAYATQLSAGRHEFSYLVRATTRGTFSVPGTIVEAMYAPEVMGRSLATTVVVK